MSTDPETASSSRHPSSTDDRTRVERIFRDGQRVAVEVEGDDAEALAERVLAAGAAEVEREAPPPELERYAGIVGQSPAMKSLFRMLERIRNSDATVLVLGENGTGKELVAKAIHAQSKRAQAAFVATNCSAFNDNLLESELFGHRRGSFTGAVADKPGLFSVADEGTFFMDEVGDMSPALQVKLLRVLQEGVFMPVGGTETKKVDVRIIAATNRDLAKMVEEGTFREDLYYRLHVVSLKVPPLRERMEDIPLLVDHFLGVLGERDGKAKVLTQRALAQLMTHDWPGNVRELENEMERVWVLSGDDKVIDEDLLSPSVRRKRAGAAVARAPVSPPSDDGEPEAPRQTLPEAVEALERQMIASELRRNKGNKTRTAEALGISRRNLIRKVQSYELEDAGKRSRSGR
ncbi:MAG TPA: sigma 54-interacting transcriptional regulator [Sandaracinaceae bacterium LLY-WYZ-13_1]|nr:sigma 54-interacting transcriptional regulator [Sandaracinaceae bacterium LLY-WYZ-13_1]